jgi:Concanavalin A-like lectin/glucanases superfamily
MALSLTWGGRADTNVAFSEFFARNHTVAVIFMLQFVNAYAGPMLTVHGSGVYFIGNGDGGGGNNKISIQIGTGSLDIPIPASFKETWHHVAVVRKGMICTVYIDGASKGTLTVSASNNPSGTLRLGRKRPDSPAVLRLSRRRGGVHGGAVGISGEGACRGENADGCRSEFARGVCLRRRYERTDAGEADAARRLCSGAQNVAVSNDRNNAADRALLPLSLVSHMRLPFAQGQIANVVQGFGELTGSHNGYAAFC